RRHTRSDRDWSSDVCSSDLRRSVFGRISEAFEAGFHRLTGAYEGALDWGLEHRTVVLIPFLGFALASLALYPFVGRDFFPSVDRSEERRVGKECRSWWSLYR